MSSLVHPLHLSNSNGPDKVCHAAVIEAAICFHIPLNKLLKLLRAANLPAAMHESSQQVIAIKDTVALAERQRVLQITTFWWTLCQKKSLKEVSMSDSYLCLQPDFEAPVGLHSFCNENSRTPKPNLIGWGALIQSTGQWFMQLSQHHRIQQEDHADLLSGRSCLTCSPQ